MGSLGILNAQHSTRIANLSADVAKKWVGRRIDNELHAQEVADALVSVKSEQKILKEEMERVLRPMRETLTARRDSFKPFVQWLAEAEDALKVAWSSWEQYRERERKKAEAKAAVAQEVAERTGTPIEVSTPAPPPTVTPTAGRIAPVLIWTWELEDVAKVPAKFLAVDAGAVTRSVRAGERDIPGIRIFQKSILKAGR